LTTQRLIRLAGLAGIFGSVWLLLFPILHPNHDAAGYVSPLWVPAHLAPHLAAMAYLFVLPAIYALQGERNGRLGLAAYVTATLALAQLLMLAWVELFFFPWIGLQLPEWESLPPPAGVEIAAPLMNLSMAVGFFLLGLSIVRAKALSRSAGVLLMLAAPFFGLGDLVLRMFLGDATPDIFFASAALFACAMAWLGLNLWQGRGERRPARPAQARELTTVGATS
jgi:hypothetical protein